MDKKCVRISEVLNFQEGLGVRNNQYKTKGAKLLNVANPVDGYVDLSITDRLLSEDNDFMFLISGEEG